MLKADAPSGARFWLGALLHFHAEVVLSEDAAFGKSELGEDLVVIGEGLDFGGARGGEGFLELQDEESGGEAVLEFFNFGGQGRLSVHACFTGGTDLIKARLGAANEVGNLKQDSFFSFF